MPRVFPEGDRTENLVIATTGVGSKSVSCLISNTLPCLDSVEKGQWFPLYLYEKSEDDTIDFGDSADLFAEKTAPKSEKSDNDGYTRKDGISDDGLAHFQQAYPCESFNKEDIFYYVYVGCVLYMYPVGLFFFKYDHIYVLFFTNKYLYSCILYSRYSCMYTHTTKHATYTTATTYTP